MADYAISKADTERAARRTSEVELDSEITVRTRGGTRTLALCNERDARIIVAALEALPKEP